MNNSLKNPSFAGIEPFEKKIWNGVYYWENQEENPPLSKGTRLPEMPCFQGFAAHKMT